MTTFLVRLSTPVPMALRGEVLTGVPHLKPRLSMFEQIISRAKAEDQLVLDPHDLVGDFMAVACWLAVHNELHVWVPVMDTETAYQCFTFNKRTTRLTIESIIDKAEKKRMESL